MRSTTAARRKRNQVIDEQPAIVSVPSVEVREPVFDPAWEQMGKDQPSGENFENGEAIDPLNAQVIVEEKSAASTGQKQGSKKAKPPKLPEWAIGTRVESLVYNTFARVEHRMPDRIALLWESGDPAIYTSAEELRDMRIVRAAVQNPGPEVEAIAEAVQESDNLAESVEPQSFKVGDRVYYQSSPDRVMEVIELCENDRLKVLRWDGAEVYADASLVEKAIAEIRPEVEAIDPSSASTYKLPAKPSAFAESYEAEAQEIIAAEPIAPSEKSDSLSDNASVEILTLTESDRVIEALYQELQQAEGEASSAFNHVTQKYFELGIQLLKRRPEFPRGTWLKWLAERSIDERYAQRAMQIGKHFAELPDSLASMSIEGALRQVQKKLPSMEGYTFREVREAYDAIAPFSLKFHSKGEYPYSFEVQGYTACFSSLEQAMKQLPILKEKYGRISQYQSVDEPAQDAANLPDEAGEAIAQHQNGAARGSTSQSAPPVQQEAIATPSTVNQQSEPTASRPPVKQPVTSEKKIKGTDAQTLKDLCDFYGLGAVAIEVLLSATVDQLDELGNWISERQLQLE